MPVEQEELQGSNDAKKVTQDGMDKIRINDLARELEVKSKAILDYLPTIGVDDKKSHSARLRLIKLNACASTSREKWKRPLLRSRDPKAAWPMRSGPRLISLKFPNPETC